MFVGRLLSDPADLLFFLGEEIAETRQIRNEFQDQLTKKKQARKTTKTEIKQRRRKKRGQCRFEAVVLENKKGQVQVVKLEERASWVVFELLRVPHQAQLIHETADRVDRVDRCR